MPLQRSVLAATARSLQKVRLFPRLHSLASTQAPSRLSSKRRLSVQGHARVRACLLLVSRKAEKSLQLDWIELIDQSARLFVYNFTRLYVILYF